MSTSPSILRIRIRINIRIRIKESVLRENYYSSTVNTQIGESRKRVSTSPSILRIRIRICIRIRTSKRAHFNISSAGNTKSGESREEVSTSPGIPRLFKVSQIRSTQLPSRTSFPHISLTVSTSHIGQ